MMVAKVVLILVLCGIFLYKLPWLYAKFVHTTDDQMDDIAKVNRKSAKRAEKRNKK